MEFFHSSEKSEKIISDSLIFFVAEKEKVSGTLAAIDRKLDGIVREVLKSEEFTGKEKQVAIIHTHQKIGSRHLLVVGIGKGLSRDALRKGSAVAGRRAKTLGAKRVAVVLPVGFLPQSEAAAQAIVEGVQLGTYQFLKYKSVPEKKHPLESVVIGAPAARRRRINEGIRLGQLFVQATTFARDMVNEPASHMPPREIATAAKRIARQNPQIKLKVFDAKAIAKLGMGAVLGVAQGSDEPPYFLHLSYVPRGAKRKIALVGKGITFDSGGLNLKPGKHIENMKFDMAGAADLLGLMSVLPDLKPKVEVHALIPTCENMPSGKALRPGDIVRTMDGKTVEVINTDAEGRLILADAMVYATRLKPDVLIDVATLTGACLVALGEEIAGAMGDSRSVLKAVFQAAEQSGEKFWELPLVDEYKSLIESDIADLKNTSRSPYGGVIEGGLFLREFVGKVPWVHLDIAGPAWAERDTNPYLPKGATGFSVRTLLHYLLAQ